MHIGLMTHIPDYLVFRAVKHFMESDSEFNHSEIRSKMTACGRNLLNKKIPYFHGQKIKLPL